MININTLVAAYNFGTKISKVSCGKTLYQSYTDLKTKLSPETWSLYQNAMKTYSFQHYYSFGLSYKNIEALSPTGFQENFTELQNCTELHMLIEEGNKMGEELENSLLQMFARLPLRNTSGILNSLDLYRDWLKIFYQMHSTKIFSYLHKHKANIENKQWNVQKFIDSKEIYPFSKHNRELIRKLAIKRTDKDIMYLMEFFDSIRKSVLQIIFETHFNTHFSLNKNEVVHYREKERNKVRIFSAKVSGTSVFSYQGNLILLFENNKVRDIGLIKRRVGRDLGKGNSISSIEGLLYPKTDFNLFVLDSNIE